jgi:hypothetical protein
MMPALLRRPAIERLSATSSVAARRTFTISDKSHTTVTTWMTFTLDLPLQLVEPLAITSDQHELAVLCHFQRGRFAHSGGRAGDDIRLTIGRIFHGNGIWHFDSPVLSVSSVIS